MSTADAQEPDAALDDEWVDIRMTDPDVGEWELDAIVADGQLEYVDLRVREDLVAPFVECLTGDLSAGQRAALVDRLAADDGEDTGEDETPEN
ncbi:hypothetical protein [Halorientalis pallida]|uniref:Uncharacterized protein n=1 Tax=Halorientalis pallida TaxID=2479928 RepID=A0A498KVP5_9EURY|nr:hypothetical protein [Halorientalis pallida]RXK48588.1 hypothetical protein EAF64_13005 [Halorientalis pallida]